MSGLSIQLPSSEHSEAEMRRLVAEMATEPDRRPLHGTAGAVAQKGGRGRMICSPCPDEVRLNPFHLLDPVQLQLLPWIGQASLLSHKLTRPVSTFW